MSAHVSLSGKEALETEFICVVSEGLLAVNDEHWLDEDYSRCGIVDVYGSLAGLFRGLTYEFLLRVLFAVVDIDPDTDRLCILASKIKLEVDFQILLALFAHVILDSIRLIIMKGIVDVGLGTFLRE